MATRATLFSTSDVCMWSQFPDRARERSPIHLFTQLPGFYSPLAMSAREREFFACEFPGASCLFESFFLSLFFLPQPSQPPP
jgi:hypothetical protein